MRARSLQRASLAQRITLTLLLLYAAFFSASARSTEPAFSETWSLLISYEQIAEPYRFFGLASFYNEVSVNLVAPDTIRHLPHLNESRTLGNEWLVISGRYAAHAIHAKGLNYRVDDQGLWVQNDNELQTPHAISTTTNKSELHLLAPELDELRYAHLWGWLSALAKAVETIVTAIHSYISSNWAAAVIILALIVKILLLPVSILTTRLQYRVTQVQLQLQPELAQIKARYDGEEAHERIMTAHAQLGVSPFYTLKPMLGAFIQLPVLVAVFNALGEMQNLQGEKFLWVQDLSYPDAIAQLDIAIPLIGDKLSVLPFLMTAASLLATTRLNSGPDRHRAALMSAGFLVLFYPFPAALVLYWATTNLLQLPLQKLLKA